LANNMHSHSLVALTIHLRYVGCGLDVKGRRRRPLLFASVTTSNSFDVKSIGLEKQQIGSMQHLLLWISHKVFTTRHLVGM